MCSLLVTDDEKATGQNILMFRSSSKHTARFFKKLSETAGYLTTDSNWWPVFISTMDNKDQVNKLLVWQKPNCSFKSIRFYEILVLPNFL